jgi:hypothetical protein
VEAGDVLPPLVHADRRLTHAPTVRFDSYEVSVGTEAIGALVPVRPPGQVRPRGHPPAQARPPNTRGDRLIARIEHRFCFVKRFGRSRCDDRTTGSLPDNLLGRLKDRAGRTANAPGGYSALTQQSRLMAVADIAREPDLAQGAALLRGSERRRRDPGLNVPVSVTDAGCIRLTPGADASRRGRHRGTEFAELFRQLP